MYPIRTCPVILSPCCGLKPRPELLYSNSKNGGKFVLNNVVTGRYSALATSDGNPIRVESNKASATIHATVVGNILSTQASSASVQVRISPAGSTKILQEQTVSVSLAPNITTPFVVTAPAMVPEGDYDIYPTIVVQAPATPANLTIEAQTNALIIRTC
jgi:hypothetical protein